MRIQEHIEKITWTAADKVLYIIYGLVTIFQMKNLAPVEYGLFVLTISLYTWIFIIVDSFALQNIIQYGAIKEDRPKVNMIALVMEVIIAIGFAVIIYSLRFTLVSVFKQPRLIESSAILPFFVILTLPRVYCIKLIFRDQEYSKLFFVNLAFFGTMSLMTAYYVYSVKVFNFDKMVSLYIIGIICSSLTGIILTHKKLRFGIAGSMKIIKLIKFSLPYTLYSGIHYIPKQLDSFLVQYFFSTAAVGIYGSAKTLFRVFDEAMNATFGLVYPPAVKLIAMNDKKGLSDMMTKAVSFLLIFALAGVVVLEAGLADFIIRTWMPQYVMAIGQFKLLMLAAIALPFTLFSTVIIAEGKPLLMVLFVSISVTCSLFTFYIVGSLSNPNLMPLGIIVNATVNAVLCLVYAKKHYGFKYSFVFRAIVDSGNFAKSFKNKLNKKNHE